MQPYFSFTHNYKQVIHRQYKCRDIQLSKLTVKLVFLPKYLSSKNNANSLQDKELSIEKQSLSKSHRFLQRCSPKVVHISIVYPQIIHKACQNLNTSISSLWTNDNPTSSDYLFFLKFASLKGNIDLIWPKVKIGNGGISF